MSLSALIGPQLPYLRRFARALTGSQASGDAYAAATLQALAEAGAIPGDSKGARRALFRAFLAIWQSIALNQRDDVMAEGSARDGADRNLAAMTPLSRVAFLLRVQEDFEIGEIADIIATSTAATEALLEQAGRELAVQLSTDILIIEDEGVIALDLEALVCDLGHRVTQIARTKTEAVASIVDHPPGLILADIRLADGSSGLDAVDEILRECQVPVIFITAYPEHLLTGDRPEPAFLVTKPFGKGALMAIISQALLFDQRAFVPDGANAT